jgi:hypothetical protein
MMKRTVSIFLILLSLSLLVGVASAAGKKQVMIPGPFGKFPVDADDPRAQKARSKKSPAATPAPTQTSASTGRWVIGPLGNVFVQDNR